MARILLIISLAAMLPCQALACEKLSELGWLLGSWAKEDKSKLVTESWVKESESKFSGLGVSLFENDSINKKPPFFEYLSIEEIGGEVFYLAKPPQNKFPTAFKATTCSRDEVIFENETHDFPKKLSYRKITDTNIKVDVLGADNKGYSLDYYFQEKRSRGVRQLVSDYVAAFNQKSLDKMLSMTDENIAWFNIDSGIQNIEVKNRKELANSMEGYFQSGFSTKSELLNLQVWGDFLFATEKASWVKEGKASSQCSRVGYQVNDSKIRRVWYYPAKKCNKSLL